VSRCVQVGIGREKRVGITSQIRYSIAIFRAVDAFWSWEEVEGGSMPIRSCFEYLFGVR
jgi:hypothetical protein